MKIDKQNGDVCFNDENHIYWNLKDNSKYISVTTLIERFGQPFDESFWSAYKALEKIMEPEAWKIERSKLLDTKKFDKSLLEIYDISENNFNKAQQDILDEWAETNRISCERGTKIHAILEHKMYDAGANITFKKLGIGGKFICNKGHLPLDIENGVYPEYLLHYDSPDGILKLAGQTDLLIKNGNDIYIGDYKGLPLDTKIPTLSGWSTIADLQEGDIIFDKDGNSTKILHKSEIHYNPCYKITFDNGKSIISDHEHRWLISFRKNKSKKRPDGYEHTIMTTEQIYDYLNNLEERRSDLIPKILNSKPLNCSTKNLPIDPYLLGVWLGDGSKATGLITQAKGSPVWDEIKKRGYKISENDQHNPDRKNVEMRTVYGLRAELRKLNLLMNKHIPDIYQRASFEQRLDLLRGFMDTDGYFHPKRKRFVMSTGQEWQRDEMIKLLATFGIKTSTFEVIKKLGEKSFISWDVCFSTDLFNPFLTRNQNIEQVGTQNNRTFRNIEKVELVNTIPTQCLEVDSPSHTFLCTEEMIVTHNTNKKIDTKSFFDKKLKRSQKMKYPLNQLDDCNFMHYTLQLSTYAWMVKQINPNFNIKDLILIHYDHNGKQTVYHCDYMEDKVLAMLKWYKKLLIHDNEKLKYEKIDY